MKVFRTDCKEWQGYKPCSKQKQGVTEGCNQCRFYAPIQENILIIEAGGLGSALRTSIVMKELKTQNPDVHIHWLTTEQSVELARNIPSVDRAYATTWENLFILGAQTYDLVINFESNPLYLSFVSKLPFEKRGFTMNGFGNLITASSLAEEFLWMQTNDHFRRRENRKSMQQILLETVGLEWKEQGYDLVTKLEDDTWARAFLTAEGVAETDTVIGLNIGSSLRHNAKRWPSQYFYELSKLCRERHPEWKPIILAGPEDIDAYEAIVELGKKDQMVFSGYWNTMSQFISLVNRIPFIVSADTFGLHVALGLGKTSISLWGPQPKHETYHYFGGGKKVSLDLECAPCFAGKQERCSNPNALQCMRGISAKMVFDILEQELSQR